MAVQSDAQSILSQFRMAEILEKLAGDNDNLRVDIQNIKFSLRDQRFEIDGKIDFNVIHRRQDPHAKSGK